jgi:DNA-binding CsgD family transcriptional regulator
MRILYYSSYSVISELLDFMEPLPIADLSKLNQSIQQIYTLHNLDTFGVDALSIVDQLVPSYIPVFHLTDFQTYQIKDTFLPNFPGLSPELQSIKTLYIGEHPLVQQMPQSLAGACKISDFTSQQKLHALEGIYQQFLRPLDTEDQMFLFLPTAGVDNWFHQLQGINVIAGFTLNRSNRSFTERDRTILNLLRPHLSQAYANAQQYQQLQQENGQLQQSLNHLGAIVLDQEQQIKSIAPQAIIWLETYFNHTTCSSQLPDHLRSWIKYQIACLKQNPNSPNACLPLCSQQAGRELTIRLVIEPAANQYLLLLEEQTLSSLQSLTLLGLSQRETEVLALIIQGKNNQAIATQLSVHPCTIRKHLEHIYTKWNVNSRTEAIAYALNKIGLF